MGQMESNCKIFSQGTKYKYLGKYKYIAKSGQMELKNPQSIDTMQVPQRRDLKYLGKYIAKSGQMELKNPKSIDTMQVPQIHRVQLKHLGKYKRGTIEKYGAKNCSPHLATHTQKRTSPWKTQPSK